jgi:hypothetical protein
MLARSSLVAAAPSDRLATANRGSARSVGYPDAGLGARDHAFSEEGRRQQERSS